MDDHKITTFDELILHLGEFGPYQKRLYFMITLPAALTSLLSLGIIFFNAHRDYRCHIPELANDTFNLQGDWHEHMVNISIPRSSKPGQLYSSCTVYTNRSSIFNDFRNNSTEKVTKCDKWVYDDTTRSKTTVTSEFNLVCDNTIYQTHASMVYMVGVLCGSFTFGIISDLAGRKIALCLSISMIFVMNVALIFSPSFLAFTVLRFFSGVAAIGCWNTAFVIGLELVGPSKRVITGMIIEIVWCLAELLLAALAYWLTNWRHLQISFAVCFALLLPYWYFIPESSRWLMARGKGEKARTIITEVARVNKVNVPNSLAISLNSQPTSIRTSFQTLVTSRKLLLRILVIFVSWFVSSMGYYGLTLNSGRIGGNIYINYTVSVVMEFVAYVMCLMLMDRIGRRMLYCLSIIIGGVACLSTIFTVLYADKSLAWITLVLSMVGKLGVSSAFATIFVFTTELFPTNLRSFILGVCNMVGKIGSAISPYIADLALLVDSKFGKSLPLMVFGIAMIVAGVLTFLIPETLNMNLPDTVQEAENLQRAPSKKSRESNSMFKNTTYDKEEEELRHPLK